MSFLFTLLAGASEFSSGAALEATGSATVSEAIGNTVAGSIAAEVSNVVDTATSTIVDTIFGANAYENKKKEFYSTIEEAKAIGLFSGDISSEQEVLQHIRDSNYTESELLNQVHNFAHDFSEEIAKSDVNLAIPLSENSSAGDILAKLSQENSVYYYLASNFLEKDLEVPQDDPMYQEISSIYNGTNNGFSTQIAKTTYDGQNTIWSEVDEVGQQYSWYFPLMNNYSPKPAAFGVYVGISSPNNNYPLRGLINGKVVESFLDKCAFFHDIDYSLYGMFDKKSDYKLISRISQNMDKMVFPGEQLAAQIAIKYFTSLGNVVRKMMGSSEPDPIIKKLFKDVYNQELTNEKLDTYINVPIVYGSNKSEAVNTQLINLINNLELELD